MFSFRSVCLDDFSDIQELSLLKNFINIPRNPKILEEKIQKSIQSFQNPNKNVSANVFMFVLEDLSIGKVIGVSLIHALHGTKKEPHFFLKVGQENKYSDSLNTGFIHGTLKFGYTTHGYTEIGGLILSPEYRGHALKLGKALSYGRFLFIAQNRELFTDQIHVELMPPFDEKGNSPLWEAIGRKFLNMDYIDADMLSRKNKEFILSLFPKGTIYETLLPVEARDAIGKVGRETEPVKKMLESLGFTYQHEVDPFDGGPHYRAETDKISLVKQVKTFSLDKSKKSRDKKHFILEAPTEDYFFRTFIVEGSIDGKKISPINTQYEELLPKKFKGFQY